MRNKEIFKLIKQIEPFKEKVSILTLHRHRYFSLYVKASFVKAYELIFDIFNPKQKSNPFFLLPNLRGVCEDLIVLGFLNSIDKRDRDELIVRILGHTLSKETIVQKHFFETNRPFQNVLKSTATSEQIKKMEDEAREI